MKKAINNFFIGYLFDGYKVKPLHVILPKTNAYVKGYDGQTRWMGFLIEVDDILEKHNSVWNKASADINKQIWWRACLQLKIFENQIKSNGDKAIDFYDKKKFLRWTLSTLL